MSLAGKLSDKTDTWYRVGLDIHQGVNDVYPVMVYYSLGGIKQSRFTGVFARPDQWDVQTERPQRGCKYYRIWMARIHYLLVLLRNYVFEQSARNWKSHYKPKRAFELVLDTDGKSVDGRYQVLLRWNDTSTRKPVKTGLMLKEEEWDASLQIPKPELPEAVEYTAYLDELLHDELTRSKGRQKKCQAAAKITVLLDTVGVSLDGTYPVRLCYTQGDQFFYRQTGVYLRESEWDECACLPLPECANYSVQKGIITEQSKLFQHAVDKALKAGMAFSQPEYTMEGIPIHIGPFLNYQERLLRSNQQFGNAVVYRTVMNDLYACFGDLALPFSAINVSWLERYEAYLINRGVSNATKFNRFRIVRAVWNKAMVAGLVLHDRYPFNDFDPSMYKCSTLKKGLSKQDIKRVINYQINPNDTKLTGLAIQVFAFSYLCKGLPFAMICRLRPEHIIGDALVFHTWDTYRLVQMKLPLAAKRIIDQFQGLGSGYLFPILSDDVHHTESERKKCVSSIQRSLNSELKGIGQQLGLPVTLTLKVAELYRQDASNTMR